MATIIRLGEAGCGSWEQLIVPSYGYFTVEDQMRLLDTKDIDIIDLGDLSPDSPILVVCGNYQNLPENPIATLLVANTPSADFHPQVRGPVILATVREMTHPDEFKEMFGGE